ncbi:TRAP transporter fused permease subunit [uncultured Sphaerochaeta sp.]|uniref:TRAP transporter permease n=1 Tax=uncultured Sphaerochaeta sp. TaxID=886478 RepID=UPI002A0A1B0C|nr:TRAP transporter fused permease subunit [uncultured Sphaerochaeta sp.]
MKKGESLSQRIAGYASLLVVFFALYRSLPFTTLVPTIIARQLTFLLLMIIVYLTTKPWKNAKGILSSAINTIFILMGIISTVYLIWLWKYLPSRMMQGTPIDVIFCTMLLVVVLDLTRRKTGLPLVIITVIFILYMMIGEGFPIRILKHENYSWAETSFALATGGRGVWGTPLGTIVDFVILFIAFGSILQTTGIINYFLLVSIRLTKRFRSGPGLVALISSTLLGMISGSAAANVTTTGNFTIPLMKKAGYKSEVAAGFEVAASAGGQWMPPVMGAGAFVMAGMLGIPYLEVIKNGFIPALLYVLSVGAMIVAISGKMNLQPIPVEEYDMLDGVTKKEWILTSIQLMLPILVMLFSLLKGFSPGASAAYSMVLLIMLSFLLKPKETSAKELAVKILDGLKKSGFSALSVAMACASAGIIVGAIVTTGAAVKFTALIVGASQGNVLLAIVLVAITSFFLGMGSPITASYLIVAVVAAGALEQLGVPLLIAHLICFWYAIDSEVTPPVCISSYAAAGIAGSNPWKTAIQGWKTAKGLYIIPILVATSPISPISWVGRTPFEIFLAIFSAALGLVVFSFVMEHYYLRNLNVIEEALFILTGVLLLLPQMTADFAGIGMFVFLIFFVKATKYKPILPSRKRKRVKA